MGNKWGIIYNGLDQQVLYSLHTLPLSPFDQVIKKQQIYIRKLHKIINKKDDSQPSEFKNNRDFGAILGNSQFALKLKQQVEDKDNLSVEDAVKKLRQINRPKTSKQKRQEYLKIEGVFTIPPRFYSKNGLDIVSFEQNKFLSIITFSGKKVMTALPINQQSELRIKVGKFADENGNELMYMPFTNQTTKFVKDKVMNMCMRNNCCQRCSNKLRFVRSEEAHRCQSCSQQTKSYWVCLSKQQYKQMQRIAKQENIKRGYYEPMRGQIKWHEQCESCHQIQNMMNHFTEMQAVLHSDFATYGQQRQNQIQKARNQGRCKEYEQIIEQKYSDALKSLQKRGFKQDWQVLTSRQDIEDVKHQYS